MVWPLCRCILVVSFLTQSWLVSSKNSGKFSIGQTLVADTNSTKVVSPSNDFAFGFHPFPNSSTNLFLLSIWYVNIPDTIVWYANGGNPVPRGSNVTLTPDDGLLLSDPQGNHLWNSTITDTVSYGFMNDTGNFVLKWIGSSDGPAWQSFDYPTDTLLPTQVLNQGMQLVSRMSEGTFTKGGFELRMQYDGNLVLYTIDVASDFAYFPYNATGTDKPPESPGKMLVYNESGDMYIQRNDSSTVELISLNSQVSGKDKYHRLTLNFNGLLTWYNHPRTTSSTASGWSEIQSIPGNICSVIAYDIGTGACGYNSVCRIVSDNKPVCECPVNYSLMDPTDSNGGCKPDFGLDDCEQDSDDKSVYELKELLNTDWPFGDYARHNPSTEEYCRTSCQNDCLCAAAIFDGTSCWLKKTPLANGRYDPAELKTAFLKVKKDHSTDQRKRNVHNAVSNALLGGSVGVSFILLTVVGFGIFFFRHSHKRERSRGYRYAEHQGGSVSEYDSVHRFTYRKLEFATNGFTEEVGRGSFGVVFKGTIMSGDKSTDIAVKRLDRSFMGADKEFTAEVNAIGLTHHKNLVRFIGYCNEEDKRLLVYEYMSNGTVADYLFGEIRPSWEVRINIARGVASGLLYLHQECATPIIHCDIKPQNILVDEHHNARISDFGLAKLLALNQSQTNTAVRGTKGYVAPEWFKNKPVSVMVDVYSFGVLLLEIVCCRRNVCVDLSEDKRVFLTDWAFDCYQSDTLDALVNDDTEALSDTSRLKRIVMVGLWCVQEDPNLRPTMKMVTMMLDGVADVPSPPCPASYYATDLL